MWHKETLKCEIYIEDSPHIKDHLKCEIYKIHIGYRLLQDILITQCRLKCRQNLIFGCIWLQMIFHTIQAVMEAEHVSL
jgi:hypothetical protein